jgi:hypothetical protein
MARLKIFRFSIDINPILRQIANVGIELRRYDAFIAEYRGIFKVNAIRPAALLINSTGNMLILVASIHLFLLQTFRRSAII